MARVAVSLWVVCLAHFFFAPTARADGFDAQLDLTDAFLTGRYDPARNARFAKATVAGGMMHRVALTAFSQLRAAALKAGIKLRIVSPTRNFDSQKRIWDAKWLARTHIADERARALDILQFSSMPGTSRHHWGTDADLGHGRCTDAACLEAPAWNGAAYRWLVANAHLFGFCQPYTSARAGYTLGYREERWHWSFHPLARLVQAAYEKRLDGLAPNASAFLGATAGASLYKDFVRNQACAPEARAMVRAAMTAIGVPISPPVRR